MADLAQRRIKELKKEIENIQRDIKLLEDDPLYKDNKERDKMMSRETLRKILKTTENINKIKYTNVHVESLESEKAFHYQADATTGPVQYHLHFKLKYSSAENQLPSINELKINCYDQFIQTELKSWQNRCIRENSLQTFQRGVVSYGELFTKREEVIVYLKENASESFLLEKCVDEGKYIIIALNKDTDTEYFRCSWELIWDSATSSMKNFFNFHSNNTEPLTERNKTLFTELTTSFNLASVRVQEIWKTLAKNVKEATEGSTSSSL